MGILKYISKFKKKIEGMKAVVAILALVATSAIVYQSYVSSQPREDIHELWSAWKLQHGREYTASEETLRKAIFAQNWETVKAHNANPESTFTMALNKFADLTGEEFKEKVRCMDKGNGDEYCPGNHGCKDLPTTSLTSWDWRQQGAVTQVKNQAQCGACRFSPPSDLLKVSTTNKRRSS